MAYNLQFSSEQWGGYVPFIDTDVLRWIRGGLTIDSGQVLANLDNAQGQAVIENGRAVLKAGSFVSLNPGTGKYELYIPEVAEVEASLVMWPTEAYEITLEADDAGVAGNDIAIQVIDPSGSTGGDVDLTVEWDASANLITVILGTDTGSIDDDKNLSDTVATAIQAAAPVQATAAGSARVANTLAVTNLSGGVDGNLGVAPTLITGSIQEETAIKWTHVDAAAAGNAVEVEYVNTGAANEPFDVSDAGGDITITLETDANGDLVMDAATLVAEIISDGTVAGIAEPELACPVGNGMPDEFGPENMAGGVDAEAPNITGRYACIVFEDADLTDGDAVVTGIDQGRVIEARLPMASDANVRTALPGVMFK